MATGIVIVILIATQVYHETPLLLSPYGYWFSSSAPLGDCGLSPAASVTAAALGIERAHWQRVACLGGGHGSSQRG